MNIRLDIFGRASSTLAGGVDLGLRLEEVTNAGGQTAIDPVRRLDRPGLLLFFLLLTLLDLLRGRLRDWDLGLGGSESFGLLD